MATINSQGVAKFDPWGMAGTICVVSHCHIPNIKAVGLVVSEKNFDFFSLQHICCHGNQKSSPISQTVQNIMQPFLLPSDALCVI